MEANPFRPTNLSPGPSGAGGEAAGSEPHKPHRSPPSPRPFSPSQPKRFIAIGIDFGTTFSGVSWAYSEAPDTIHDVTSWPSHNQDDVSRPQVPTQINLENGDWGYLVNKNSCPLRWITLLLLRDCDIPYDIRESNYLRQARAQIVGNEGDRDNGNDDGNSNDAVANIISRFLKKIWEHTLNEIQIRIGESGLQQRLFRVAIAVPAIWPQYAKEKMHQAARTAGILANRPIGKTFFMLVEALEVAALAALFEWRGYPGMEAGDVVTVCDAGGGTVDVISYKIKSREPYRLDEFVRGEGALCGDFLVNEAFEQYIKLRVDRIQNLSAAEFRTFVNEEWEYTIKRTFTDCETNGDRFIIRLPHKALPLRTQLSRNANEVPLTKSGIAQFYAKSLSGTRDLISAQVKAVVEEDGRPPRNIILVGGLGSSRFMFKQLQAKYGNVFSPVRPWSVVARGATFKLLRETLESPEFYRKGTLGYLYRMPTISSRISKLSYGIEYGIEYSGPEPCVNPPFDRSIDRVTIDPDGKMAVWRMKWFLRKNKTISNRVPVTVGFYDFLPDPSKRRVSVIIYTSNAEAPPVRRDASVRFLCKIERDIDRRFEDLPPVPNTSLRLLRMTLTLKFDGEPKWALQVGTRLVETPVNVVYTGDDDSVKCTEASNTLTKSEAITQQSTIGENSTLGVKTAQPSEITDPTSIGDYSKAEVGHKDPNTIDDNDGGTTFSKDASLDIRALEYLHSFADRLAQDTQRVAGVETVASIDSGFLEASLKEFTLRLHGESSNPFQWETSVILHRNRKEIMRILAPGPSIEHHKELAEDKGVSISEKDDDDDGDDGGARSGRQTFQKPLDMLLVWVDSVEPLTRITREPGVTQDEPPATDPTYNTQNQSVEKALPRDSDYDLFIRESDAYQWLLSRIRQHSQIAYPEAKHSMFEIGTHLRDRLRAQKPLSKISRRRPSSQVRMKFDVNWNPLLVINEKSCLCPPSEFIHKVLVLTGSLSEAQATTVREYVDQTWPATGAPILGLLEQLISVPEGRECSYHPPQRRAFEPGLLATSFDATAGILTARIVSSSLTTVEATGSPYFVSEIAEQISWLATTIRSCPKTQSSISCEPRVEILDIFLPNEEHATTEVVGSCKISFDFHEIEDGEETSVPGSCWTALLPGSILARGYPILRRTEPNSGLEIPLGAMAFLIRSRQVVKWGERILMKAFNSMLAVTRVAGNVVFWHLLSSGSPTERISYVDLQLDGLDMKIPDGYPLRALEGSRHIIGWCANAKEFCGQPTANLKLLGSGLPTAPPTTVIERLYLEVGAEIVGGLNMCLNKKEQPVWLERENDYPSLLRWVSLQIIVFYDVSDRRAWLVDGASALLHLVRASLYLDKKDPESTYDWVLDANRLDATRPVAASPEDTVEDRSTDCTTGRQLALRILKDWDKLNLEVFVKSKGMRNGESVVEYSTLESRVKKILHSFEIIIDRAAKIASQDGIKISQTLDRRRDITGFDVLDIISPLHPVQPRAMKDPGFWDQSWTELLPLAKITTIFGNGFGELIKPHDEDKICQNWKSVPTEMDYLAASVTTIKLLYERHLRRIEPNLDVGEMSRNIMWSSPGSPFQLCQTCVRGGKQPDRDEAHRDPVQFLTVNRSWNTLVSSRSPPTFPINIQRLEDTGAVVFGRQSFLGKKRVSSKSSRLEPERSDRSQLGLASTLSATSSSNGASSTARAAASVDTKSNTSAVVTLPSSIISSGSREEERKDIGRAAELGQRVGSPERKGVWRVFRRWRKG